VTAAAERPSATLTKRKRALKEKTPEPEAKGRWGKSLAHPNTINSTSAAIVVHTTTLSAIIIIIVIYT
jgi:hypothetical protein